MAQGGSCLGESLRTQVREFARAVQAPLPLYATALCVMLFCLELFGVLDAAIPFIYFQF